VQLQHIGKPGDVDFVKPKMLFKLKNNYYLNLVKR